MPTARASAPSACVREDLLVPALLLAERGIEIARPALRSPRTKAAVSIPLVAVALKLTLGDDARGRPSAAVNPAMPFASTIESEARRNDVPPRLVAAVVAVESHFKP